MVEDSLLQATKQKNELHVKKESASPLLFAAKAQVTF